MCYGSLSPMGKLMGLLQSGRELPRADGPRFLFNWSDDEQTVSFAGHRLHLDQFRFFAKSLLTSSRERCSRRMGDGDHRFLRTGSGRIFAVQPLDIRSSMTRRTVSRLHISNCPKESASIGKRRSWAHMAGTDSLWQNISTYTKHSWPFLCRYYSHYSARIHAYESLRAWRWSMAHARRAGSA